MQNPSAPDRAMPALQEWLFLGLAILCWAIFVVSIGKDTSWDFRNYHWYAPYAFLNNRLGFDVAVAHQATYYNPVLDVPFYWLATHTHAWFALGVLGAAQGANVVPLYLIARSILFIPHRALASAALALVSMTGGMTISLAGTTYYDNVLSVLTLSGLALLVINRDRLANFSFSRDSLARVGAVTLIAGFCVGSAVGLKLPQAPYAVGFAAALAIIPGNARQRSARLGLGALGGILGIIVFSGFWWAKMYALTGNPLFPYFNQYFHSPLALDAAYRDTRFLPDSLREALLFPILFSIDYRVANDLPFTDIRIGLAYVAVIASLALWAFGLRAKKPLIEPGAAAIIFAFVIGAYVSWLAVFAIYRYILALEMLAPLVLLVAIGLWPLPPRTQLSAAAIVILLGVLGTKSNILERAPVDDPYVQVSLPPIADPHHSLVLMTGEAPMGFIVPSLPPAIAVLRIDGWMIQPQDGSRMTAEARARVKNFTGQIYVISNEYEMGRAREALADYDLSLNWIECRDIETNLGGPYRFCPVKRGVEEKS